MSSQKVMSSSGWWQQTGKARDVSSTSALNAIARFEDEGDPMIKKADGLWSNQWPPRLTASQETRNSDLWPQRIGFSQQPELAWKQILPQILQVRAELSWHLDASLVKPRTWNPGKPTGMSSPENCETMNGYCFNLLIFCDMLDSNKQN